MEEIRIVKDIADISNAELLAYYHESVLDETMLCHDGEPYNESGFSQDDIAKEILKRMNHG
jgi:hypothetical protein